MSENFFILAMHFLLSVDFFSRSKGRSALPISFFGVACYTLSQSMPSLHASVTCQRGFSGLSLLSSSDSKRGCESTLSQRSSSALPMPSQYGSIILVPQFFCYVFFIPFLGFLHFFVPFIGFFIHVRFKTIFNIFQCFQRFF